MVTVEKLLNLYPIGKCLLRPGFNSTIQFMGQSVFYQNRQGKEECTESGIVEGKIEDEWGMDV